MKKKVLIPIMLVAACTIGIGGYSLSNFTDPEAHLEQPVINAPVSAITTNATTSLNESNAKVINKTTEAKKNSEVTKTNNEKVKESVQAQNKKTEVAPKQEVKEITPSNNINKSTSENKITETKKQEVSKSENLNNANSTNKESKPSNKTNTSTSNTQTEKANHKPLSDQYIKKEFANTHKNSEYNDVRNSAYNKILNKLGSNNWYNYYAQVKVLNAVNNISDSKLKSISHGEDPEMSIALLDYSYYPSIPVRIDLDGTVKTFNVSIGSIG